ncbi:ribonuclease III [Patescibacteria group bacterium]|nr:ribonuclease III [Patescibacteria group bacterium]MBU1885929.1 ribonuclease III [Patescibacteria group bacterium]
MLPQFNNSSLLETALTHRSALNEKISPSVESNERLEFLGDAVLELITTEYLFGKYPTEPEGILTTYRSALVKTTTLAEVAQELDLGQKLYMSNGEEATGGRTNPSLLADTTEAIIGALYLDQGYQPTKEFLNQHLFHKFDKIKQQKLYRDAKSFLQEIVQAKGFEAPVYEVIKEEGPDHNKKFTVKVLIDSQTTGTGLGKSKQTAQQAAAQKALEELGAT